MGRRGGAVGPAAGPTTAAAPASDVQRAFETAAQLYSELKFEECLALLKQLPASSDVLLTAGACCYQLKEYKESMRYNERVIQLDPKAAAAYCNLGNCFRELGELDSAIEGYKTAVTLKPDFLEACKHLAFAYLQRGDANEAIAMYSRTLALEPRLPDAQCNLGNLLKQQGRLAEAKACYTTALQINPQSAIAWNNMASVLKDEGDMRAALLAYRESVRLEPQLAEACANLGNALKEAGQYDEAIVAYRQAAACRPECAVTHGNLAALFYERGQLPQAIAAYRRAVQLMPAFPDALNNLGNVLREAGELDEAVGCYREAIRLQPSHHHAYNNLGNAMKDRRMLDEARRCYGTALRLCPHFAAAHSNLASLEKERGPRHVAAAVAHYLEAIRIDPYFVDAYANLGNAYLDAGMLDDAIRCYLATLQLRPDLPHVHCHLASTYKDVGRIAEAMPHYLAAVALQPWSPEALANLIHTCQFLADWTQREPHMAIIEQVVDRQLAEGACPSVQPFHAFVYPLPHEKLLALAAAYARRAQEQAALLNPPTFAFAPVAERDPTLGRRGCARERRLRVGYVSSDFANHPLSHLMQSVFGFHDRDRYDVYCYSLRASDGSCYRRTIEAGCETFRECCAMESVALAELIHADGIHVLVNLNGYTKGARMEVFAMRPAPLQLLYMGFPGSTGAPYIDYVVTDRRASPHHLAHLYSEKLLCMPHSYFVNDHRQSFPPHATGVLPPDDACSQQWLGAASHPPLASYEWYVRAGQAHAVAGTREELRAKHGLPPHAFLFCCFNQLYKLEPRTFRCWCAVLKAVPNSALWLLRFPALAEPNIRAAAAKEGVGAERIIFTEVADKAAYVGRSSLADLFLDTPMCNGHTTGCDLLWAGVPVLTHQMETMCSRVAGSLNAAAGLAAELNAPDMAAYVRTAVGYGTDRYSLLALRRKLWAARTSSALFDTRLWTREWEAALRAVWERHARGLAPDHVDSPHLDALDLAEVAEANARDEALRNEQAAAAKAAAAKAAAAKAAAEANAVAAAAAATLVTAQPHPLPYPQPIAGGVGMMQTHAMVPPTHAMIPPQLPQQAMVVPQQAMAWPLPMAPGVQLQPVPMPMPMPVPVPVPVQVLVPAALPPANILQPLALNGQQHQQQMMWQQMPVAEKAAPAGASQQQQQQQQQQALQTAKPPMGTPLLPGMLPQLPQLLPLYSMAGAPGHLQPAAPIPPGAFGAPPPPTATLLLAGWSSVAAPTPP